MTQLVLLEKITPENGLPVIGQAHSVPYRLESQRISIQASILAPTKVPVAAKVHIDVSNDGKVFKKDVLVFSLSGTGEDTDIDSMDVPYEQLRVRVSELSGASVQLAVTARV